ncbi:hypothetical protein [Mycoplasma sp. SG1]|uniref:hypothetical protein n=1 Tax=Mycoplasma sp. SG1 TaxID=2810348 RepID=UPI0020253E88|nr:hypothetical protein [Mycoplasma sp. SG1]URM52929.1 hypothetical protein JRW51_01110 [Mycoplasma sp. SG1]
MKLTIILVLKNYKASKFIDLKTKLYFLTKLNPSFKYQLIVIVYDCDQVIENLVTYHLTENLSKKCQSFFVITVFSEKDINIYHSLLDKYVEGEYIEILNQRVILNKNYFDTLGKFFLANENKKYDIIEFSSLIKTKNFFFSFDTHHNVQFEKKSATFQQQLLIVSSPFVSNKVFRVKFLNKYGLLCHFYNNSKKFLFIYCVLKLAEVFIVIPKTLITHEFLEAPDDFSTASRLVKKINSLEQLIAYFIYTGELYVYYYEIEYMVIRDIIALFLIQFSLYYQSPSKQFNQLRKEIDSLNIFINTNFPNYNKNYYVEKYLNQNIFSGKFLEFENFLQIFKNIYESKSGQNS